MSNSVMTDFLQYVKGNSILKRIARKRSEERNFAIFVMPDANSELNECAMRHLEAYRDYTQTKEIIFVVKPYVYIPEVSKAVKDKCIIRKVIITDEEMQAVLHFGAMFNAPYLCFISLDKPYGRHIDRMLGHKELTLDEIICIFIYNLRSVPGETEVNRQNVFQKDEIATDTAKD